MLPSLLFFRKHQQTKSIIEPSEVQGESLENQLRTTACCYPIIPHPVGIYGKVHYLTLHSLPPSPR